MFIKINVKLGYWEVPIREEDIPKIAFKMRWGLFEYLAMPFGVDNDPLHFMHLVRDVVHG